MPAGPSISQSRGSQLSPPSAPPTTLLPPPLAAANSPMRPPPSPMRTAGPGQGAVPVGSHAKGVSLMEAGNWDAAVKAFGQALDNARGDVCVKEAQYLAAVMLLRVQHPPLPTLHQCRMLSQMVACRAIQQAVMCWAYHIVCAACKHLLSNCSYV